MSATQPASTPAHAPTLTTVDPRVVSWCLRAERQQSDEKFLDPVARRAAAAAENNEHHRGHRDSLDLDLDPDHRVDNKDVAASSEIETANTGRHPNNPHPPVVSIAAKNSGFSAFEAQQSPATPSILSSRKQRPAQLAPSAAKAATDEAVADPSASSPPSECGSAVTDQADPLEIEKLWQAVYEHKQRIESEVMLTTSPTTAPRSVGGGDITIAIVGTDLYPKETCATHFGARFMDTAKLIITEQDTSQLFAIYKELRGQRGCETLPELKCAVETHLTPRHSPHQTPGHVPSPAGSAPEAPTWVFRRFLRPEVACDDKSGGAREGEEQGGRWKSIKARLEHERPSASITFWLARMPAAEDLTMLLEDTAYTLGPDNAICPYLSIEFQESNEGETAAAERLARMGGDALYNRFRLREKLMRISQRERGDKIQNSGQKQQQQQQQQQVAKEFMARDWDKIRHYGVIIGWDAFSVWVIEPNRPRYNRSALDEQDSAVNMTTSPAESGVTSSAPASRTLRDLGDRAPSDAGTTRTGSNHNKASVTRNAKPWATKATSVEPSAAEDKEVAGPVFTPPPVSTQWHGGRMRQLFGTRYRAASVDTLARWINTIHHWAAVDYAGALEADISAALRPTPIAESGEARHAAAAAGGGDGVVLNGDLVTEETIGSQEQALWRERA